MGIEINNTKEELFKKGKYAYKEEQYEKALSFFNESLICDENFSKALLGKAKSLYKLGKLSESLIIYDELFDSNCLDSYIWLKIGNFYYYVLDNNLKALKSYNNGIKFDNTLSVLWINKGKVLISMNMYEEALDSYIKASKLDNLNYKIYNNIANTYKLLNFMDKALNAFNKSISIKTNIYALLNKAIILNDIGRFNEALNCINYALNIKIRYDLLYYKALILYNIGKYGDSLNFINQSLAICDDDNSWELKTKLSYILGDFKNTLMSSNHVLISNPLNIGVWFYKINSLIYLNKLEDALNSCNEVLKYDFNEYFIYKKACLLMELNRLEESIKICDTLLSIDYNNTDFLFLKSKIFYKLGNLNNAIKIINELLDLNPFLEDAIEFKEFLDSI
ncbi:MAG: tetratricopeptide repeat protein [Methanobrevibacter sp.]